MDKIVRKLHNLLSAAMVSGDCLLSKSKWVELDGKLMKAYKFVHRYQTNCNKRVYRTCLNAACINSAHYSTSSPHKSNPTKVRGLKSSYFAPRLLLVDGAFPFRHVTSKECAAIQHDFERHKTLNEIKKLYSINGFQLVQIIQV